MLKTVKDLVPTIVASVLNGNSRATAFYITNDWRCVELKNLGVVTDRRAIRMAEPWPMVKLMTVPG